LPGRSSPVRAMTSLKDFKEMEVLGRGSFGEALLVLRKKDNMTLVLKKVKTGPGVPEKERVSAEKEMDVLKKFTHPHVVKYYDSFQTPDLTCIVMEYCGAGALSDMIEERQKQGLGGYPESEALDIFVQLVMAVEHVHARKVLHRDLKPANIFVSDFKMMKLGDFGIARQLSTQTSLAATVVGTPYYLSPEMCKGQKYDGASDVWALGCILAELLAGKRPFEGFNLPMIVMSIVQGKRDPLPASVSEETRELVDAMLDADPSKRPTTSQIMSERVMREAAHQLEIRLREATMLAMKSKAKSYTRRGRAQEDDDEDDDAGVASLPYPPSHAPASGAAGADLDLDQELFAAGSVEVPSFQSDGDLAARPSLPVWGRRGTGCFMWGDGTGNSPLLDLSMQIGERPGEELAVAALAVGRYHKLCLMVTGEVRSWVYNGHRDECVPGQLGHGPPTGPLQNPRPIAALAGLSVMQIACGSLHCLALIQSGQVWAWGDNECGQCGLGEEPSSSDTPRLVQGGDLEGVSVLAVGCGEEYSMAMNRQGGVLAWGNNERGQLGLQDQEEEGCVYLPTLTPFTSDAMPFKAVQIACGKEHAAALALDESDQEGAPKHLFTWGDNQRGQLGHPLNDDMCLRVPRQVKLTNCSPKQVSCGANHTAMLSEDGSLWMWGAEECMQKLRSANCQKSRTGGGILQGRRPGAGLETPGADAANLDQCVPTKVDWSTVQDYSNEEVKSVVCGDDCTVALTRNGRLYSWYVIVL